MRHGDIFIEHEREWSGVRNLDEDFPSTFITSLDFLLCCCEQVYSYDAVRSILQDQIDHLVVLCESNSNVRCFVMNCLLQRVPFWSSISLDCSLKYFVC